MTITIADQITFVHNVATDSKLRDAYLKNPAETEKNSGVTLDAKLRDDVLFTLKGVDKHVGELVDKNPFKNISNIDKIGFDPGRVMNVVLEAAAVVAAAAAVVTAATAVYNSVTKNLPNSIDHTKFNDASRSLQSEVANIGLQTAAPSVVNGFATRGAIFR